MAATPPPLPAPQRPVIELKTPVPGIVLRSSFDQRSVMYLTLVHLETGAPMSVAVHTIDTIRAAANQCLQCGPVLHLLADGEAERFLTWLRNGGSTPNGVN